MYIKCCITKQQSNVRRLYLCQTTGDGAFYSRK